MYFLYTTLPFNSPENIFTLTQSRLHIPIDVLFTRLLAMRKAGLTPSDDILRGKLASIESRLLLFQYGPEVMTDCTFCNAEDPMSYFYYALPALIAPHLFNICVVALVTSGLFTGKAGAGWRTSATITAVALVALDVYLVGSYNHKGNVLALRLGDIDFFFWKIRIYRGIALAGLDGILGWVIYLTATNRAFVVPRSPAERLESSIQLLTGARGQIGAVSVVRNASQRDEGLRAQINNYWTSEASYTRAAHEHHDVVEATKNALRERINVESITASAQGYADSLVRGLPGTDLLT